MEYGFIIQHSVIYAESITILSLIFLGFPSQFSTAMTHVFDFAEIQSLDLKKIKDFLFDALLDQSDKIRWVLGENQELNLCVIYDENCTLLAQNDLNTLYVYKTIHNSHPTETFERDDILIDVLNDSCDILHSRNMDDFSAPLSQLARFLPLVSSFCDALFLVEDLLEFHVDIHKNCEPFVSLNTEKLYYVNPKLEFLQCILKLELHLDKIVLLYKINNFM